MSSPSAVSPATSTAALIPRLVSNARSPPSEHDSRSLSPPRESTESYTLWQPILRGSDQIVLYNPSSHAIDIVPASLSPMSTSFTLPHRSTNRPNACPYCHRPMDDLPHGFSPGANTAYGIPQIEMSPNYFQLLQDVNGGVINDHELPTHVRPSFARFEEADDSNAPSGRWSRVSIDSDPDSDDPSGSGGVPESLRSLSGGSFVNGSSATPLGRSTTHLAQPSATQPGERESSEEPEDSQGDHTSRPPSGYYATFFREETRLGMGANGSVFLCQHVLNGIPLGHFAVKKIAVGESTSYLMEILREFRTSGAFIRGPSSRQLVG
ncbi:putative serine/threonine-protein kinase iks1 [Ceratobasidium sp. 414]|nr:putative serine/threonine-protein kinase iks1 [Ceratobasidium sp. 414]